MTSTPPAGPLQRYANARILLFSNQLPGVLDSPRTGRFLFEGFIKRLRQISSKDNSPGVDTGDFSYESYPTRAALLPLTPTQPWDWLSASIPWSTSGTMPVLANGAQFAAFSVSEFGRLYAPGGVGPLCQLLLGERIEASLKPNRVVVTAAGDSLNVLAGFHTPETLANYLGVPISTIDSWNASGHGPPFVKLGDLVRYTYEDVEAWLARQIELSRG